MIKVVFLVSSNGGFLKFLHQYLTLHAIQEIEIIGVIGDRDCLAIKYANSQKIENKTIKYNKENRSELFHALQGFNPDLIVTNIFKILDKKIVTYFENKLINFHYSLLPSFKGLIGVQTIKEAKKLNCKFIGTTCHFVDENVDNGKIISQAVFHLSNSDEIEYLNSIMFRANCLMGLNIIYTFNKLNHSIPNSLDINGKNVLFSPMFNDNLSIPDESFWDKIKSL